MSVCSDCACPAHTQSLSSAQAPQLTTKAPLHCHAHPLQRATELAHDDGASIGVTRSTRVVRWPGRVRVGAIVGSRGVATRQWCSSAVMARWCIDVCTVTHDRWGRRGVLRRCEGGKDYETPRWVPRLCVWVGADGSCMTISYLTGTSAREERCHCTLPLLDLTSQGFSGMATGQRGRRWSCLRRRKTGTCRRCGG